MRALHAIGDAAVRLAIDVLIENGTPSRRHGIEHLELTAPEDDPRLATAGIAACIFSARADPAIFGAWPELLGGERCARAFAFREFADAGVRVCIGTDAPTGYWKCWKNLKNLYTATTRMLI
ncbi:hypothetical protein OQA88_8252 [Cercophora sp. LCS_1]